MRLYDYVGDPAIRERVLRASPPGRVIASAADLAAWHEASPDAFEEGCTFVVSMEGALLLAPRRSEHVACAGGAPVLAAGEIRFTRSAGAGDGGAAFKVAYASNHSTGYCPEPSCYEALAAALGRLGVQHPGRFPRTHDFRRCPACGQINLIKDDWWYCAVCGEGLPRTWNLEADRP